MTRRYLTCLVRSKARSNWRVPGAEHQVRATRNMTEYVILACAKLREEAGEVSDAMLEGVGGTATIDLASIMEECGDLLSVLRAVVRVSGLRWADVESAAYDKDTQNGSWDHGKALVWDRGIS